MHDCVMVHYSPTDMHKWHHRLCFEKIRRLGFSWPFVRGMQYLAMIGWDFTLGNKMQLFIAFLKIILIKLLSI